MRDLVTAGVAIIIAQNLRRIRKKAGLTQEEVANRANISRATYNAQENGKRIMDISTLVMVASALNVTTDEVLKGVFEVIQKQKQIDDAIAMSESM